jgi:hypothetical protein
MAMRLFLILLLSCLASALKAQQKIPSLTFKEGILVDKYSKPYPGWILHQSIDKVRFKESKKSKAEVLGIDEVKAFSIETDSFVTVNHYEPAADIKFAHFAKVLLRGSSNMLLVLGIYETYVLQPNPGAAPGSFQTKVYREMLLVVDKKKIFPLTKFNFYLEMPSLVSDNDDLVTKINSQELTYSDMERIIRIYEESHNRKYSERLFPSYRREK